MIDAESVCRATEDAEQEARVRAMRRLAPLGGFSADVLKSLAARSARRLFQPGDTILTDGQVRVGTLPGIISGRARLVSPAGASGEFDVSEVTGGMLLGFPAFLVTGRADISVLSLTALTEVEIVEIDEAALSTVLSTDIDAVRTCLTFFAGEAMRKTAAADHQISDERRVLRKLVDLAERKDGVVRIAQMPRHIQLAEMCGVTDQAVASAVALLIEQGVVSRDYPGLVIHDIDALHNMAF